MVAERLENTAAAGDVLATLGNPAAPPIRLFPEASWRVARFPMSRLLSLAAVGLLPPQLRRRLGRRWTRAQELELRGLAAAVRSAGPLMPGSLRNTGPAYLRWRRDAISLGASRASLDRAA